METYRLKNIAILILLLLNAFLLMLLGYQHMQSRQSDADTVMQLQVLFDSNQLSLADSVDPLQPVLSPMALSRSTDTEADMADALLGGGAESASQGGGIYSYTSPAGILQFRSGGSFDSTQLSLPVEDIQGFVLSFCEAFGYQDVDLQLSGGSGTATAVQYVAGVPILGCGLTMAFHSGALTQVSGAHITLDNAALTGEEQLTCASALVRFLDYRSAAGIICSQIASVSCIYYLREPAFSLVPVWQVQTDTYTYLVDASSGDISRL